MEIEKYHALLEKGVEEAYKVANEARKKGYDYFREVEIKVVKDIASRVEGLLGYKGIAEYIREYEKKGCSREEMAFEMAKDIARGGILPGEEIERIEKGLRVGLAILTEGVLVAPTEGVAGVKLKENVDGGEYLAVYYAGPIRSAGGTAAALSALLLDYIRQNLGIGRFKPRKEHIERYVEEMNLYERFVAHLQYKPEEDHLRWIASHLPVEIDGEGTTDVEVSAWRNVPNVETNRVRGGAILVLCEGIAQKAKKVLKYAQKFSLDWNFLEKIIPIKKEEEKVEVLPDDTYLEGSVAGRPILAFPSRIGGFRLRYGKSRTNGLMAKDVHPALLPLIDEFLAIGTHMRVERPGKGCVVQVNDKIHPPVVLLENGEVRVVKSREEAIEIKDKVKKILFLGDILVTFGDFLKSGHVLIPSPYVEEWWEMEAKEKNAPFPKNVYEAITISKMYSLPLHPKYLLFWDNLTKEEFLYLYERLKEGKQIWEGERLKEFRVKHDESLKKILEKMFLPHRLDGEDIVIPEEESISLLFSTGILEGKELADGKDVLEILSKTCGVEIRGKSGSYIGAKVGRPEKARPRKMDKKEIHVLFPTGTKKQRSILSLVKSMRARGENKTRVEIGVFKCFDCGSIGIYPICEKCGKRARYVATKTFYLALPELVEKLKKRFGDVKELRGVAGMFSSKKIAERLEKGWFRAKHNVFVFKDGTSRFDSIDLPLTHFKPKEINTPVEKLRELGYTHDIEGKELESEDQVLALYLQDVILPRKGLEYLFRVANFIDDILENLYGMKRFYNLEKPEDLIGHFIIALAPHTSSGVLGRIIGYTDVNGLFAHPVFHAAKRRNCDGDEDSFFLLLDGFLNFSRIFLSDKIGGTMDSPITLTTIIEPREVDDEVHCMEIVDHYPLSFYKATLEYKHPSEVDIKTYASFLTEKERFYVSAFTIAQDNILDGNKQCKYVQLNSIPEKVEAQARVQEKIFAVDNKLAILQLIEDHFLPDLYGNLHGFSTQTFRCTSCHTIYRRIPLTGKCYKCNGSLTLTVSEGGIVKYLNITKELVEKYDLPSYIKERVKLLEEEINILLEREETKQKGLMEFMG